MCHTNLLHPTSSGVSSRYINWARIRIRTDRYMICVLNISTIITPTHVIAIPCLIICLISLKLLHITSILFSRWCTQPTFQEMFRLCFGVFRLRFGVFRCVSYETHRNNLVSFEPMEFRNSIVVSLRWLRKQKRFGCFVGNETKF